MGVAAAAATVAAGGARRARHRRQLTRQLARQSWRPSWFLLNKYGAGASRLAAAEEVVCEGEKTREERDAELRGEAVSLDE